MENAYYEQRIESNDGDKDVQSGGNSDRSTIRLKVSYGSHLFGAAVPLDSTFGSRDQFKLEQGICWGFDCGRFYFRGYLKKLLSPKTGLEPKDQRLIFRGREKDDADILLTAGLKDNSKLLLMEQPASKEKRIEETKRRNEMQKQCEAVAAIRSEVDKLVQKVDALRAMVDGDSRVEQKEVFVLSELLMVQLLKLDGVAAEGEAKVQRKNEVRRIQCFVDILDALKAKNSNPYGSVSAAILGDVPT